ncbi:MAG: DNA cytosine methyltransferase [Methylorubrum rhodinum]|uniref:DNA cytosine methyltransferase n=1 Tax=Methylorubrum rhodinum TaxID=29428 RepID=UPI003BB0BF24
MPAYYNEHDAYAAAWLRNLIAAGHIAPGVVDERDIRDVRPSDLDGFVQCHFFAGIGVWSYALRLAGWPDDRPVWTGSCPCQPFSAAGGRGGFADERHLWPSWHHLIEQCRPAVILGEQVASKDGLAWLDLVQADLEGSGYGCGAVDLCAAGVGAPHIRQRLWFVAHTDGLRGQRCVGSGPHQSERQEPGLRPSRLYGGAGRLADAGYRDRTTGEHGVDRSPEGEGDEDAHPSECGGVMGDAERVELRSKGRGSDDGAPRGVPDQDGQRERLRADAGSASGTHFWSDADWIACQDGKARPVEPGTFPLAHGAPARVGRLRAYGNAINAETAAAFIEAADGALLDARLFQLGGVFA